MSASTGVLKEAHRTAWRVSRGFTAATHRYREGPDFLIVGAQRCGTTSMYTYLSQHPAVIPAVLCKGVHYFDVNHERGDEWYIGHFPTRRYRSHVAKRVGHPTLTGESSPYYLFHPAVPVRVARTIPEVRIIVMLRDPVARAHSQYRHEVARGYETLLFEEALASEHERIAGEAERLSEDPTYRSEEHQHHSYVARGFYAEQLDRWRANLPADQILVVDSGDFFARPERAYRDVLAFLGLPPHELTRYPQKNARHSDPMSATARSFLEASFDRPNRSLRELLDITPSWLRAEASGPAGSAVR